MERIVVISSNNNPDYLFYAPYMIKAWHRLNWKVCIMVTHDVDVSAIKFLGSDYLIGLPDIPELRSETVAQSGRLYAANYLPKDALIMTSDMDLLPLTDYWNPDPNNITNYGHDLTGFSFYPMGYTAMTGENWVKVMNLTGDTKADMLRDSKDPRLKYSPYAPDWEQWWNFDWDLLTNKLQGFGVTKILRGHRPNSHFAYGRVDRGDSMQIPQEALIDAHCENVNVRHPDKLYKFLDLFNRYYGEES